MGDLLTAMVGYDAFTQALTNPLLAPQVFTEATFTRAGLRIIRKTATLQQILARNVASTGRRLTPLHLRPRAPRTWRRRGRLTPHRAPAAPSFPSPRDDARPGPVTGLERHLPRTGGAGTVRVKVGPLTSRSTSWRLPTGDVDGEPEGRNVSASISVPDGDYVPSEIVSTVFYSATVSDTLALVVAESVGGTQRLTWGNEGATQLLGYGLDDLRSLPVEQLFPTLGGGELKLLLRRERAARMTLPVRTASGEILESVVMTTPSPSGRMWTMRILSTANEHERALRATADAHERRFSALTERSPVPTLLSEQGMRLAHVNDAFCTLVGLRAEQLLGTGWINTIHEDDLDGVIEQVAAALDGDEVETQARLVRDDGSVRTTVIRFAHLFTPGVGAGFVGTIEDITDRLAFETKLAHQANHDPLTGLPNRTLLAQYVAERFRPGTSGLACLFLDLDNFKVVNDSLGHTAGDELLVEVADRLRATVRPGDLVARFGGDEFVVVCEKVDEEDAVALAGRVSEALARPMRLGGVDIRPYASVGVTVQTAEHERRRGAHP